MEKNIVLKQIPLCPQQIPFFQQFFLRQTTCTPPPRTHPHKKKGRVKKGKRKNQSNAAAGWVSGAGLRRPAPSPVASIHQTTRYAPTPFASPVRNRGTPNLYLHFPIRNRYTHIIPINFDFPLQTVDAPLPPMPQVESATASEAPPPQDAWLVELGSRLPQWESLRDSSKVQSTDAPVFSPPRVCSAVW